MSDYDEKEGGEESRSWSGLTAEEAEKRQGKLLEMQKRRARGDLIDQAYADPVESYHGYDPSQDPYALQVLKKEGKPLSPKQKRFCYYLSQGMKLTEAAELCDYTHAWASQLARTPVFRKELLRLQEKVFERPIAERMRSLAPKAIDVIEEILEAPDDRAKLGEKANHARWLVEMVEGKATQRVESEQNVLVGIMDTLKDMKDKGQVLDVTPAALPKKKEEEGAQEEAKEEQPANPWAVWAGENLD